MSHRHEGPPRRRVDERFVNFTIKIVRDLMLFSLGAFGFVYEVVREGDGRAPILVMCAAMMGLPVIIRGDEKRQEANSNGANKPEGGGDDPKRD